jgi:sulfatase maturation enzyme AslB (radical SAM superfamily)
MNSPTRKKQTICPYLWDTVFIDVAGDVFFCCRKEPISIGNIYQSPLESIRESRTAQNVRNAALCGQLECHRTCVMLTEEQKQRYNPELTSSPLPLRKVHIEHHEFCNISCIMCYQRSLSKRRALDNEILLRNVPFVNVEEVQLQGGEPLAYKPCMELFHHLIDQYNVPVTLQTNGTLITDTIAKKIAANCLEIMIAVNAGTKLTHETVNHGSDWETVLSSVDALIKHRNRLSSWLRVELQMTMVRENVHELPTFVQLAKALGVDSISVSWEHSVPQFLNENDALYLNLREKLLRMKIDELPVFLKPKHIQRLEYLFDLKSSSPCVPKCLLSDC